jgi:hypothetical protein
MKMDVDPKCGTSQISCQEKRRSSLTYEEFTLCSGTSDGRRWNFSSSQTSLWMRSAYIRTQHYIAMKGPTSCRKWPRRLGVWHWRTLNTLWGAWTSTKTTWVSCWCLLTTLHLVVDLRPMRPTTTKNISYLNPRTWAWYVLYSIAK